MPGAAAATEDTTGHAPTKRKITRRACDGCRIRKIRCTEGIPPCDGCVAVGIPCTFVRKQHTRGPRKLRASTIQEIAQTQGQAQGSPQAATDAAVVSPLGVTSGDDAVSVVGPSGDHAASSESIRLARSRIPSSSLVLQLCIYRTRMFSVWPIVRVEQIITSLSSKEEDVAVYALANAVGAATVAQLKLPQAQCGAASVSAKMMEAECQRSRVLIAEQPNLTTIRIAFFLHVYHENQDAGSLQSLLYLREAITMAQIMRLDRESAYTTEIDKDEQQLRRRILWLLFVTERGVSMFYKLPVVLKPNIAFSTADRDDEMPIVPAFQKLVNLFWLFNQNRAFDVLQDSDSLEGPGKNWFDVLQKQLQGVPINTDSINDVQQADIAVTRQYMRALLWRVAKKQASRSANPGDLGEYSSQPFQIAADFLETIAKLPNTALEAHGRAMEQKVYEIALAVVDATATLSEHDMVVLQYQPKELLGRLQEILLLCSGGNKRVIIMLRAKIAELQGGSQMLIAPSPRTSPRSVDDGEDNDWQIRTTPSTYAPGSQAYLPGSQPRFEHRSNSQNTLSHPGIPVRRESQASRPNLANRSGSQSSIQRPLLSPHDHRARAESFTSNITDVRRLSLTPQLQHFSPISPHQMPAFQPWDPSTLHEQDMAFDNPRVLYEQLQNNYTESFENLESNGTMMDGLWSNEMVEDLMDIIPTSTNQEWT